MPSEKWSQALAAMSREREAFRAAVARANDQLRLLLARTGAPDRVQQRETEQLGWFASGRIDPARYRDVFSTRESLATDAVPTLRFAQYLFKATLTLGDEAFIVHVLPGEDLRDAVTMSLSTLGRVFAAAHVVNAIRSNRFDAQNLEPLMSRLTPDRWTKAERSIAPPLVVELSGSDLRPGGLEIILQGAQKIVLLVNDTAPPAALVRLITPHVFVQQCGALSELSAFSAYEGPGIAALIPNGLHFIHQPNANGAATLRIVGRPAELAARRLPGITQFQQNEEREWLEQLAQFEERPMAAAAMTTEQHQPGDQLAAWLLKQAQLS